MHEVLAAKDLNAEPSPSNTLWLRKHAFSLQLSPFQEKYSQAQRIKITRKIALHGGFNTFSNANHQGFTLVVVVDDDIAKLAASLETSLNTNEYQRPI